MSTIEEIADETLLASLIEGHPIVGREFRKRLDRLRTERDALWRALEPFTEADVSFYGDGSIGIWMDDAEALRAASAALESPKEQGLPCCPHGMPLSSQILCRQCFLSD